MPHNDLEKFIQDHRQEFDDAYPSLKLWTEIERELGQPAQPGQVQPEQIRPTRIRRMRWYSVAASVLVLMTLAGLGGHYLGRHASQPTTQEILAQVAPDFSEVETYYSQEISERYAQLTSYQSDPDVDADLAQIDVAMEELRAELADAPPGREEQLVQQLIASYRLKLQILERVLESLERAKANEANSTTPNTNNNSDETSI